ncbi:unnamed protein product, partial [Adineta steineri]
MKCQLCDNNTWSIDSNTTLCPTCRQINRSDLFSKILATLLDMYSTNKEFDVIKDKCIQFNKIIKNYPLFITPFCTFDPDEHDTDRIALPYLRTYVISEDNNILQKHLPVKMDTPNGSSLYKTIAILCRLDTEDGARELRVRNVIDMIINAEVYHSADPDLHSCLQWGETWKYFVLEQLRETQSMSSLNAVLTLCLHSLSNIINMRIRSVYPNVPGGNDDLRKRLDRIFSPLETQSNEIILLTITILWSNTKHISSHSTSTMWIPDTVIPLLPKPDCYTNDMLISPRVNSAALQNPAERSFYILSCFCPITQSALNEVVSYSEQQKHSEAEMKKKNTKVSEFQCPKCSKICNDYRFDWRAVTLFRQNFNGARLTYILVDITSSMTFNLLKTITIDKKSSLPRIIQTKEAIKQLLKEIAAAAGPLDQAILTTFDDKLKKPALIPLCDAIDVANVSNLNRIDAIELSPRSIHTYFYTVLKEVYEMFEQVYHSADPDLHSCLQWGETWKYFVLEQLRETQSMSSLNAVLTLCIHSLSNIINMRIRSVYPNVPGGSDDLRKRLDRIFSPLETQSNEIILLTITILWSNTKHISSHSTSTMWIPDTVIPLLPKPDCYTNDMLISPRVNSAALQNPAERSFYILSCFCPITQSALNEVVSYSEQQKHSEAEMKKDNTKVSEFQCPKCSKICNDYRFDWRAVTLFRQNFNGARLTYILVDITSSMTFNLLKTITIDKKSSLPRIIQTKEAIKQLLKEIAAAAGPLDQAILTTFDDKIKKPALIPLCDAIDVANVSNLNRIDAIELSPRSIHTYFYTV